MNTDKRIQELLDEYAGKPAGDLQGRVRERLADTRRSKRRAASFRWAFVGACFVLIALAGLLVVPRAALATRLREVHRAIAKAKSVRFIMVRKSNGKERPVYWAWIEGPNSRRRVSLSPNTDVVCVVKGRTKWTHALGAPQAFEEPYDPARGSDEFDSDVDALAYAKEITSVDSFLPPPNVDIEPHADVDGRKAYSVVADRDDGRLHASMVVDAATNLPISIAMEVRTPVAGTIRTVKTSTTAGFGFNEQMDPRLFEPVFGPSVKIVETSAGKTRAPEVARDSNPGEFITVSGKACVPEALFAIPFGTRAAQIGVDAGSVDSDARGSAGSGCFAITKGGELIVADVANRKIKEFDRSGRLVYSTEGSIEGLAFVAAGPEGTAFAVSGPDRNDLSKYGRRGEQLWKVRVSDAMPAALHLAGRLAGLTVASDGTIAAKLDRTDWIACFTKDGKFDSVRPGVAVTDDGRFLSFTRAIDLADAVDAVMMDTNGRMASKTRLAPLLGRASLVSVGDVGDYSEPVRDEQGCWYRVWIQRKEERIELKRDLQIRSEGIVTKYSPDGVPLAQGTVDLPPSGSAQSIAVDPAGYLYTLSYHPDRVSVVRYWLPTAGGK